MGVVMQYSKLQKIKWMTLQYWTSIGNSVKPGSAKQTPAVNVTYRKRYHCKHLPVLHSRRRSGDSQELELSWGFFTGLWDQLLLQTVDGSRLVDHFYHEKKI